MSEEWQSHGEWKLKELSEHQAMLWDPVQSYGLTQDLVTVRAVIDLIQSDMSAHDSIDKSDSHRPGQDSVDARDSTFFFFSFWLSY